MVRFRWAVAIVSVCFVAGAYLDVRSRASPAQLLPAWQVSLLLASWLGLTGLVGVTLARNLAHGVAWREALPDGQHAALLGCAIFGLAALLDSQYQQAFGVETGPQTFYAPMRLVEMAGGGLMVAAPLRIAVRKPGGRAAWRVVLSAALTLSAATFVTLSLNPLIDPVAAGTAPEP